MVVVLGIAFILLLVFLQQNVENFRANLLHVRLLYGVILIVVTEILSLFHWVTFWGVTRAWMIVSFPSFYFHPYLPLSSVIIAPSMYTQLCKNGALSLSRRAKLIDTH